MSKRVLGDSRPTVRVIGLPMHRLTMHAMQRGSAVGSRAVIAPIAQILRTQLSFVRDFLQTCRQSERFGAP